MGFNVIIKDSQKLVKIGDIKKYDKLMKHMIDVNYKKLYGLYYVKYQEKWYVDLILFFKDVFEKKYDERRPIWFKFIVKCKMEIIKKKGYKFPNKEINGIKDYLHIKKSIGNVAYLMKRNNCDLIKIIMDNMEIQMIKNGTNLWK